MSVVMDGPGFFPASSWSCPMELDAGITSMQNLRRAVHDDSTTAYGTAVKDVSVILPSGDYLWTCVWHVFSGTKMTIDRGKSGVKDTGG